MPADPRAVLDHCGLGVTDMTRATDFYAAALGALGLAEVDRFERDGRLAGVAYGLNHPAFWIGPRAAAGEPRHVAFVARSRAEVDAFYRAGLEAGGRDHGAPGERAHYEPGYYAAFLLDPDGHNIEAVFRNHA